MTTITINNGTLQMPNTYAVYMYSPFPLIVTSTSLASVNLWVSCAATGLLHQETRALHEGRAEFDLSYIARLLAPDVDGVFSRPINQDGEAAPYVELEFELEAPDGQVLTTVSLVGLYGAMDALEERFGAQRRRIWVNYPQTLQIWRDIYDEIRINGDYLEGDYYPELIDIPSALPMVEMDVPLHLNETESQTLRDALKAGNTAEVTLSCRFGGRDTLQSQDLQYLTLVPDLTPRGAGTYLRWLHRDGTFGYWCFCNGTVGISAGKYSGFQRRIEGNPSEPVNGAYRNAAKQDFTEGRQLSLGTRCETAEEYEYLCGLATSPVVERLVEVNRDDRWQRVNVLPGSYSRSLRYNTPNGQLFEITVELPERNTINL